MVDDLQTIKPIILAGGIGSRAGTDITCPKQFIPCHDGASLYQHTLQRIHPMQAPYIVTNQHYKHYIQSQTHTPHDVLYEPIGRNTAAAMTIAAMRLRDQGHKIALSLPSDHKITDIKAFHNTISQGLRHLVTHHHNVLFGICPTYPHDSYGYIQTDPFGNITNFIEKPDTDTATHLLNNNPHTYWNSGLFLFSISSVLNKIKYIDASFYILCERAYKHPSTDHYNAIPYLPFDQLFMEHDNDLFCIEAAFDWADIGHNPASMEKIAS